MLVKCRNCGKGRTTQPWNSTRKVMVNLCLFCSPGRVNRPPVTGRVVVLMAEFRQQYYTKIEGEVTALSKHVLIARLPE